MYFISITQCILIFQQHNSLNTRYWCTIANSHNIPYLQHTSQRYFLQNVSKIAVCTWEVTLHMKQTYKHFISFCSLCKEDLSFSLSKKWINRQIPLHIFGILNTCYNYIHATDNFSGNTQAVRCLLTFLTSILTTVSFTLLRDTWWFPICRSTSSSPAKEMCKAINSTFTLGRGESLSQSQLIQHKAYRAVISVLTVVPRWGCQSIQEVPHPLGNFWEAMFWCAVEPDVCPW